MIDFKVIKETDPQVCEALELELARQQGNIELIASENIVTPAVMAAAGSHLTNKYAEGYSGKRYYGGCKSVRAFRSEVCQRSGAQRSKRESRYFCSVVATRRYRSQHEPCSRRTPFARQSRKYFR